MRKTTTIKNKIISGYTNITSNISIGAGIMFNENMLEMFRPASEVEVKEIIEKSPNNSCDLDPLSTSYLKKSADELLLLIIAIINRSFVESVVPLCTNLATITPLLK